MCSFCGPALSESPVRCVTSCFSCASLVRCVTSCQLCQPFTKPPLLKENRLTGGGSPNVVDFVKWKVPLKGKWETGSCNFSIHFTHDRTIVFYLQLIQNDSLHLHFALHKDTGDLNAATHQLYTYIVAKEVGVHQWCHQISAVSLPVSNVPAVLALWIAVPAMSLAVSCVTSCVSCVTSCPLCHLCH